jgi:hypothetical protein
MDRRERIPSRSPNALLVAIRAALEANQAGLWTALPATVAAFDASKVTVSAQATVQAQVHQPDGKWIDTTLPLCVDCPIVYPGGGDFVLTFPLKVGDEGVLVFASRCIDSWWQSGGVQKQAELRMHDLSDGFFFPTGGMSQPHVPSDVSTTGCQLRNKDGTTYVEIAPGNIVNVFGPAGINLTGNVTITGNLLLGGSLESDSGGVYAGNLRTSGEVTAGFGTGDAVGLKTHLHSVPPSGTTGPPTAGT